MFKVRAANLDAYFAFDPAREAELRAIDEAIRSAAPGLARWFVAGTPEGSPGMAMSMIGYGRFTYRVRSSPDPIAWPVVGLALQKNYLSLYFAARRGDAPFLSAYSGRLGDVKISQRGVLNFVRAVDIDQDAFAGMLRTLEVDLQQGRVVPRYGRASAGG